VDVWGGWPAEPCGCAGEEGPSVARLLAAALPLAAAFVLLVASAGLSFGKLGRLLKRRGTWLLCCSLARFFASLITIVQVIPVWRIIRSCVLLIPSRDPAAGLSVSKTWPGSFRSTKWEHTSVLQPRSMAKAEAHGDKPHVGTTFAICPCSPGDCCCPSPCCCSFATKKAWSASLLAWAESQREASPAWNSLLSEGVRADRLSSRK